jgi:hypothetical protein
VLVVVAPPFVEALPVATGLGEATPLGGELDDTGALAVGVGATGSGAPAPAVVTAEDGVATGDLDR